LACHVPRQWCSKGKQFSGTYDLFFSSSTLIACTEKLSTQPTKPRIFKTTKNIFDLLTHACILERGTTI
jgi:hypothetical protein